MYTPCTVTFCSYCEHSNKMHKEIQQLLLNMVCRQFMPVMGHSNNQEVEITA